MLIMKNDYKRLGNYIREVDVRNRDLKVTKLLGDETIRRQYLQRVHAIHCEHYWNGYVFL